jgi:hypothetical protein
MRFTVCGSVAVVSLCFAVPALAQAPGGPPPPGARPPAYYPPPPPPGYYPPPPPANQERTAFNGIYVEGLGPGFFYSLNYDRVISDIALRLGIGYISVAASAGQSSAHAYFLTLPFDINYIGIGSKKHIFEIGGGATVVAVGAGASSLGVDSQNESATKVFGHLNIGYRLQPPEGGFMLRTGLSPIIGSGVFLPWPYIALGATF